MIGIYQIRNTVNNKVYIGQAQDVNIRWGQHRSALKNNNHGNKYLQASWVKYGEKCFEFTVIEEVSDIEDLSPREQYWMDFKQSYTPQNGYNISIDAEVTWRGMSLSKEHIDKIRKSNMGKHCGSLSKEHREKLSIAHTGKRHPHSEETKRLIGLANKNNHACGWSKGLTKKEDSRIQSPANKGKKVVYTQEGKYYV